MIQSKTIVFIHGLFMNPASWATWIKHFEEKGYTCYAPPFPFHEGSPSELRNNPNPKLGKLTIGEVVNTYLNFIEKLPEKPILIGHSIGGFVVQKLINLDKAAAGICIDSVAPNGINTFKWSFWKANLPIINPLKGDTVFTPSVNWFQFAFTNTLTTNETEKIYNEFVVPESRNIPRTMLSKDGKVDFKKAHQPLLFIAGEKDNIIPKSLNKENFKAYKDKNSQRDFKEFEGRTHFICGQNNWQEVALFINNWIKNLK